MIRLLLCALVLLAAACGQTGPLRLPNQPEKKSSSPFHKKNPAPAAQNPAPDSADPATTPPATTDIPAASPAATP